MSQKAYLDHPYINIDRATTPNTTRFWFTFINGLLKGHEETKSKFHSISNNVLIELTFNLNSEPRWRSRCNTSVHSKTSSFQCHYVRRVNLLVFFFWIMKYNLFLSMNQHSESRCRFLSSKRSIFLLHLKN